MIFHELDGTRNASKSRLLVASGIALTLAIATPAAVSADGLGGLVSGVGDKLGDNVVGNTVGSVGDTVSDVGSTLNGGGNGGGTGDDLDGSLGGGTVGGAVGGTVNTVGTVLNGGSGSGGGNNGGGDNGGGNNGGGNNGGGNNGGGGNNNGGDTGGNGTGGDGTGGTDGMGTNGMAGPGAGRSFATTCEPLGIPTYNSFTAADSTRKPIGQIQGVVLEGDTIVQARFLTDSVVMGERRCITLSGTPINVVGSSLVLPITQTQLFQRIGG